MKTEINSNVAEIPEYIFEWMQEFSFSELEKEQQAEVLEHFSEEEYNSLYKATSELREHKPAFQTPRREAIKVDLMERFEKKHAAPVVVQQESNVVYWKAAAGLALLIAVGSMTFSFLKTGKTGSDSLASRIDTVFVERQMAAEPQIIHDTVFIAPIQGKKNRGQVRTSYSNEAPAEMYMEPTISVATIRDIDNPINGQKRNSMRDDSLAKRFAVVTL